MSFKNRIKTDGVAFSIPPRMQIASGIIIVFKGFKNPCNDSHAIGIFILRTANKNRCYSSFVGISIKNNVFSIPIIACGMLLTAFSVALFYRTYLYPQVSDFFVKAVSTK